MPAQTVTVPSAVFDAIRAVAVPGADSPLPEVCLRDGALYASDGFLVLRVGIGAPDGEWLVPVADLTAVEGTARLEVRDETLALVWDGGEATSVKGARMWPSRAADDTLALAGSRGGAPAGRAGDALRRIVDEAGTKQTVPLVSEDGTLVAGSGGQKFSRTLLARIAALVGDDAEAVVVSGDLGPLVLSWTCDGARFELAVASRR